jgi:hypothetical protein
MTLPIHPRRSSISITSFNDCTKRSDFHREKSDQQGYRAPPDGHAVQEFCKVHNTPPNQRIVDSEPLAHGLRPVTKHPNATRPLSPMYVNRKGYQGRFMEYSGALFEASGLVQFSFSPRSAIRAVPPGSYRRRPGAIVTSTGPSATTQPSTPTHREEPTSTS